MKIAIFTPSFLPKFSGAEIFHHNLASRLASRGHRVTVILPRKTLRSLQEKAWDLPYQIDSFPANVWSYYKRWPSMATFLASLRLGQLQRKYGFDVWHGVMMYPTGVSLVPWANAKSIPHLVRSAGDDVISSQGGEVGIRRDKNANRLIRNAVCRAQAVVALSEAIHSEFVKIGVNPGRIHTIPNAVDLARFQKTASTLSAQEERIALGLNPDRFLFLAVGRNHPQKNYPALLEAAKRLQAGGLKFQVLLLGRRTEEIEATARASGLSGVFQCQEIAADAGGIPQIPPDALVRAYCAADAFVMPSVLEGFSTALLEAMAAALPVITTDAPGCKDFVRNGKDALMIPVNDVAALAEAMRLMASDSAIRQHWSSCSQVRAADFGWETVVALYENLYLELVEERARRIAKS